MVTLVGVCHFLYFIILVSYNFLDYFWYIKYQHINIYVKMGKEMGKEKKRNFPASRGGFRPSQARGTHARGRRPSCGPRARETARARGSNGVTAGPHVSESRGGGTAPRFDGAGEPAVCGEENLAAGGLDGDSPPVARFLVHGEVWLSTGRGWRS
jgi:hypothetical protein